MNLDETRAFVAVVRAGSFTGAGQQLGVPKSTLSRQVRRLEDRLGARLLERSTRRVALTELGQAFHERCAAAIAELEEAERLVEGARGVVRGVLRVSTTQEQAVPHLTRILPEFLARHPELRVELDLRPTHVDLIESGIDVAIRGGTVRHEGLIVRRLLAADLRLFASPSYIAAHGAPRDISELAAHPLVALGPLPGGRSWVLDGPKGPVPLEVEPRVWAGSPGVVRALVLEGSGIGLSEVAHYLDDFRSGQLVRVLPELGLQPPDAGLYVVYPSRRHLTPKVRAFVDFVIEKLAN